VSIEIRQQLQPALQVKVSPKQIAANAILEMSSVELQAAIATELDENPALEMTELPTCPMPHSTVTSNVFRSDQAPTRDMATKGK